MSGPLALDAPEVPSRLSRMHSELGTLIGLWVDAGATRSEVAAILAVHCLAPHRWGEEE